LWSGTDFGRDQSLVPLVISIKGKTMHLKSVAIASLIALAWSFAVPVSADTPDTGKTVTCKDGSTSKGGQGACSHHGGVQQGGASGDAHEQNAGKAPDKPTAKCKDGTLSYSKQHSGACSHHGGVAEWLDK